MKVRRAHPEDAALIDELLARAYPALMADAYRAKVLSVALPSLTKSNAELLKSGTYYVAERSGRILGCADGHSNFPAPQKSLRALPISGILRPPQPS